MAATLKERPVDRDQSWVDFARVARDLAGDGPLDAIPLVQQIAAASVGVFASQDEAPLARGGRPATGRRRCSDAAIRRPASQVWTGRPVAAEIPA